MQAVPLAQKKDRYINNMLIPPSVVVLYVAITELDKMTVATHESSRLIPVNTAKTCVMNTQDAMKQHIL